MMQIGYHIRRPFLNDVRKNILKGGIQKNTRRNIFQMLLDVKKSFIQANNDF